jgi:hypothetical protein
MSGKAVRSFSFEVRHFSAQAISHPVTIKPGLNKQTDAKMTAGLSDISKYIQGIKSNSAGTISMQCHRIFPY